MGLRKLAIVAWVLVLWSSPAFAASQCGDALRRLSDSEVTLRLEHDIKLIGDRLSSTMTPASPFDAANPPRLGDLVQLRAPIVERPELNDRILEVVSNTPGTDSVHVRLWFPSPHGTIHSVYVIPSKLLVRPSQMDLAAALPELPRAGLKRVTPLVIEAMDRLMSGKMARAKFDYSQDLVDALEATNAVAKQTDYRRAGFSEQLRLLKQLNRAFFPNTRGDIVDLNNIPGIQFSHLLRLRKGVCLEASELMWAQLYELGLQPRLIKAWSPTGRRANSSRESGHAWIEVDYGSQTYIVDVGLEISGRKSEIQANTDTKTRDGRYFYFDRSVVREAFRL